MGAMTFLQARYAVPFIHLGLSGVAFALSLHTPKQTQRLALLPLVLATAFLSLSAMQNGPFPGWFSVVWGQTLIGYALHTVSTLHIKQLQPPTQTVPGSKEVSSDKRFDLKYFARLWLNPRLINVQPRDAAAPRSTEQQENSKHSRVVFLILQLSKLFIYYIIEAKISPAIFDEVVIDILPSDVDASQQSLWKPLYGYTARECLNVTFITFSTFWQTFVHLDGTNALMAAFFVAVGLHDPEDWPPLFGNISDAVGLRRFWSKFWHSLPTKPSKSIGDYISFQIFRFSQRSFAHKATIAFTAFGISGLAHAFFVWQGGNDNWYPNLFWFLFNFVACMAEAIFVKTIDRLARRTKQEHNLDAIKGSWLGRFIGYAWVFLFFCWTVPFYRFPAIHRESLEYNRMRRLLSNMQVV